MNFKGIPAGAPGGLRGTPWPPASWQEGTSNMQILNHPSRCTGRSKRYSVATCQLAREHKQHASEFQIIPAGAPGGPSGTSSRPFVSKGAQTCDWMTQLAQQGYF
eukprot:1133694-Pelagomonas_calceolata.AAC.2